MRHACLRALLAISAGMLLSLSACSDNTTGSTTTGGGAQCPESLKDVTNSEFCAAQAGEIDCSRVTSAHTAQVCGVPVLTPPAELQRSANVEEYSGKGAPDAACYGPAAYPAKPGMSQKVSMSGIAKIFSHGCESKNVKIEVYTVKRTGGADDGDVDQLTGSTLTTADNCQMNGVASEEEDCGTRYECKYIYANVPTETELVVKTYGDLWSPLYDYNVYIPNDAVVNGVWEHDVRALASDDYNVIAQAAIGGPVTTGNGAIAGEVHDCDDVRLINATVAVDQPARIVTYFTSDEDHPLPDLSARGTSTLGLYSALDIAPGPVSVAATGLVDGSLITLGYYRARIFPNAVTTVTFRGLRPFQVP